MWAELDHIQHHEYEIEMNDKTYLIHFEGFILYKIFKK